MAAQRLFLRKTPKEKLEANPKLPYFELCLITEGDNAEFQKIGVFWKSKTGNGYSGTTADGAHIQYDPTVADQARQNWKNSQKGENEAEAPIED